jgi:Protein of unknown function (DUF2867)
MKLPNSEHESLPWRIHELVSDFTLEDVWALPMRGGPDDFQDLLDMAASFNPSKAESRPTRLLWSFRDRLGAWFGLGEISTQVDGEADDALPIPNSDESSLRDRLPADLRGTASGFTFGALPFVPLYRLDREAAAEVSNKTVHGVAHLSWVKLAENRYEGRMAVYVKPRGAFGRAYMALIKPFRYWIVYPALMQQMDRAWNERPIRGASTGAEHHPRPSNVPANSNQRPPD